MNPHCLEPRRLSLDENVRTKEGGKEETDIASLLSPSHGPLCYVTSHLRFAPASVRKIEVPEEVAGTHIYQPTLRYSE